MFPNTANKTTYNSLEAFSTVEASRDPAFRLAFGFTTLAEAVLCQTGSGKPSNFSYEYNPFRKPSAARAVREAFSPPTAPPTPSSSSKTTKSRHTASPPLPPPTPSTPRRKIWKTVETAGNGLVYAPSIEVHINNSGNASSYQAYLPDAR